MVGMLVVRKEAQSDWKLADKLAVESVCDMAEM